MVSATLLAIDERFAREDTAVSTYLNAALGVVRSGGTTRYVYSPFGGGLGVRPTSTNS